MLFSQIIPPSPSPIESKSLFYSSVSLFCNVKCLDRSSEIKTEKKKKTKMKRQILYDVTYMQNQLKGYK